MILCASGVRMLGHADFNAGVPSLSYSALSDIRSIA